MKLSAIILQVGIAEGLAKGLNILLVLVLPFVINLENFGIISILIAFEALIVSIITFQQPDVYIRFYSNESKNTMQLYRASTTTIFLIAIVIGISITFFSQFSYFQNLSVPIWSFILVYVGSVIQSNFNIYLAHLRVQYRIREYSMYRLIFQIVKFITVIVFAIILRNASAYIIGYLFANCIITIILLCSDNKNIRQFFSDFEIKQILTSTQFKNTIKIGLPIAISSIISLLFTVIDRFFIQFFLDIEDVGIYNFAYTQGSASFFFLSILTTSLLPKIYESGKYDAHTRKKIRQFLLLGLIFTTLYALFAYFVLFPVLSHVVSSDYSAGRAIVLFSSISMIMLTFQLFCRYSLMSLQKVGIITVAIFTSLLLKVLLSFLLIPEVGINGAGISAVLSRSVAPIIMFLCLSRVRRKFKH